MKELNEQEIDRIIGMAWEDRTPFEAIYTQFGLREAEVIDLMRSRMKRSSFEMWRKRTNGRVTKHSKRGFELIGEEIKTFKCDMQRNISFNKMAKRTDGKRRSH